MLFHRPNYRWWLWLLASFQLLSYWWVTGADHSSRPLAEEEQTLVDSSSSAEFQGLVAPIFKEYCLRCHNDKRAKGDINLQNLSSKPAWVTRFKTWEKILDMLREKEMPPEDEPQLDDPQRQHLIRTIEGELEKQIRQRAGDPGRIALRRFTSAEYACSILDLTGLDLDLERHFISDAAGGEGFSNVGDVQFIQDTTLEHYLEAAKKVAAHAVIGAGPLLFYPHPGKTGQELSAIERIQKIYRIHGFRTASGEGGTAFGLEVYPKAFFAAWRFQHRAALETPGATLETIAKEEAVQPRFLEYIWKVLHEPGLTFPSRDLAAAFHKLPAPAGSKDSSPATAEQARRECQRIFELQRQWQAAFAENTGDAEEAGEANFKPSLTNSFRVRMSWLLGATKAVFHLSVEPIVSAGAVSPPPTVLWKEPTLRFGQRGGAAAGTERPAGHPLKEFLSPASAGLLRFRDGASGDFATVGATTLPLEFQVPAGMTQAVFTTQLQLENSGAEDCVVRCLLSHQLNEGATAATRGTFSVLLANPDGPGITALKNGVAEFARLFPRNSHREAAPSDRDPIPPPFDNSYNNPERNEFHYIIKYHRDDRFLTEHMLDSSTRYALDQAWADLLGAFDYHDTFLKFVAAKFKLDLGPGTIASLTSEWIDQLPPEPRNYVLSLRDDYAAGQTRFKLAEEGHLADALRLARQAWRRPLATEEMTRLRSYYSKLRQESKLDHAEALRAMLARILVSPAFLYKIETPGLPANDAAMKWASLSGWELATRLSYFLWSSIPDAELTRAAGAGELTDPKQLAAQAARMLRDPKARRFAAEFFGQWFGFYRFDEYRGVDTTRFGEFTDRLRSSLHEEAVAFFEHIVREDRPVGEILFADYAFLNDELARHYGVPLDGLSPNMAVAKISGVNRLNRGGLLRLGAVLAATSAPLRTSPVKRGDWVLRRVLGKSIPPPPGDAGSIPPDDVLADGKTVRQRLEMHRREASCVNCHARIDPFGFALENFDSIGRWRESYRDGQSIDAGGVLSDGTEIRGFDGLISYLQAHEADFHRALCAKLLGYALGRGELISDRPLLERMTSGLRQDSRFSTLITQIVTSTQFRFRRGDPSHAAAAAGERAAR